MPDTISAAVAFEKKNNKADSVFRGDGRVMRWRWVNFQCLGVLLILILVGQGPTALTAALDKLPVPGRPTNLASSRARAYCTYSRCGWGLFGHFYSLLSFLLSFSLSLGDGPI